MLNSQPVNVAEDMAKALVIYRDVERPHVFQEAVCLISCDRGSSLSLGQDRNDLIQPQHRNVGLLTYQ